jgi:hypothetical protein
MASLRAENSNSNYCPYAPKDAGEAERGLAEQVHLRRVRR